MTRLNFTERRRLTRDRVDVVIADAGGRSRVEALVDLADLSLDPSGEVVLEAYHQTRVMRVQGGSVAPEVRIAAELTDFPDIDTVKFRVKVTSPPDTEGRRRLLAVADRLRPRAEGDERTDRDPLLTFRGSHDLGQRAWRLDLSGAEPVVEVNAEVGDWRAFVQEPVFSALVFPEVFRQVLMWLVAQPEPDDDPSDPTTLWRQFVQQLRAPAEPEDPSDSDAVLLWADEVVDRLARQHDWFDALVAGREAP